MSRAACPSFEIYSGFDDNFARNVMSGGNGCIAALSNLVPEITSAWVRAFRENDLEGIALGQQKIDRLWISTPSAAPSSPMLKEAIKLRGIASSSAGTFPMPNATLRMTPAFWNCWPKKAFANCIKTPSRATREGCFCLWSRD